MRATVTLSDDVAYEVLRLRRERGISTSAAINELARAGIARRAGRTPFRQTRFAMGARMDVSNIGDVLDHLDDDH